MRQLETSVISLLTIGASLPIRDPHLSHLGVLEKKKKINSYHHKHTLYFTRLRESGHTIPLQWIPSHCCIRGNVITDKAAALGHLLTTSISVPFTRNYAARLVRRTGEDVSSLLLTHPDYHYKHLYTIDPNMKVKALMKFSRALEAVIHRLRLEVTYTHIYFHRIGRLDSTDCATCHYSDTIREVLRCYPSYDIAGASLKARLGVCHRNFTSVDVVWPWQ